MKPISRLPILFLLLALLSCGCGKENIASPSSISEATGETTENLSPSHIESGEIHLLTEKYLPLKLPEQEESYQARMLRYDTWGQYLYILDEYTYETGTNSEWYMHIFDMETEEIVYTPLSLDISGYSDYYLYSMDVINASDFSLVFSGRKDGTEEYSRFLYRTDMSGKCKELLSPLPNTDIYPWNPEGGTWQIYDIPNHSSYITQWMDDSQSTAIYTYDTEALNRKLLTEIPSDYIYSLCQGDGETIYYTANNHIYHYDFSNKISTDLCDLRECGITAYGDQYLLINDQHDLALAVLKGDLPGIYYLTDASKIQTITDDTIRMSFLIPDGLGYTTKQAAMLSATSDHIEIKAEKENRTQHQEAFRERILAEMAIGKGPELLWVSREDMHLLAEKNLLMDISSMLPADTREQLLPGVLQIGTIDNKLVAITPQVSFHTMLASDAVWKEDSWTLFDVLNLLENSEANNWPFLYFTNKLNYYSLFYMILAKDWEHSPFVDLEQGISYFNDPDFIRTLELCKKYGVEDGVTIEPEDRSQMLADGKSIGRVYYFYDGFQNFSTTMATSGDFAHIVGYPVNEGSGNYLYGEGYLVVNANAVHTEEIQEFLKFLLDYEQQYTVEFSPVRRDVLRDRVIKRSYSNDYFVAKDAAHSIVSVLDNKPEGGTYLEEFMAFAESAVPEPMPPTDITAILGEELPGYFTDSKSAQETAAIIHNRVQLYFEERK